MPSIDSDLTLPRDEENQLGADTKDETADDTNLVGWDDENDPANPLNWGLVYKVFVTFELGLLAFAASLGSSIISPAQGQIAARMGVSSEVTVLTVSLYVLGFALGPCIWGPISEVWGRRWSMLPAMFCLGCFSIGTATSQNAASVFITRFFAGLFGSAPVSNVSAAIGDMYSPYARGVAGTFYGLTVVGGPTVGPLIGAALTTTLGWRWTEYLEAIWVFFIFGWCYFFLPEVYSPVILKWKAQRLRKETGNPQLYHPHEHLKLDPVTIVTKYFTRPVTMLCTEPMIMAIALYASFVYGLLYLTLEVFPIVFEQHRGWSPVISTLPFLGLFVGIAAAIGIILANQPYYFRQVQKGGGVPVPEARMPPVMIGAPLFCAGLFWFGWTADPSYHWILPVIAAGFIGAGFNCIFQQCILFLVDTYGIYAASAVAANTFLRSLIAAGLPLAAKPMFNNMGVGPAMSVLGAVAAAAIPVPFILAKFGPALRRRSKFAPTN